MLQTRMQSSMQRKKGTFLINNILFVLLSFMFLSSAQAGMPLWTLTPVPGSNPRQMVPENVNVTISYTVSNHSSNRSIPGGIRHLAIKPHTGYYPRRDHAWLALKAPLQPPAHLPWRLMAVSYQPAVFQEGRTYARQTPMAAPIRINAIDHKLANTIYLLPGVR